MKKKYCFSATILLFLSHNKLYVIDLVYCFNINSCIFLFSTMSKKVCLFSLYIFVSTRTYQIVLLYQSDNIMLYADPIHCYYSYTCIFLFSFFIPIVLDLGVGAMGTFPFKNSRVGFESCAVLPIVEALLFAPIVHV
jgi:hypothetical protein